MSATVNTCTTLALHDSEKAKYLSKPMDELATLSTNGCDLCGDREPTAFYSVCGRRQHYAGNCCAKDKSKWFKTVSDRRGDHKRCPVAGCAGTALDNPVFEAKLSAVMVASRKAVEHELHEAISAEIRDQDRAERNARAPSRKRKADVIADEGLEAWEAKQAAKKARADARKEAEEVNRHNSKMVTLMSAKMVELMGRAAFEEWRAAATAPPAAAAAAGPSSDACEECDEEM
jgi:hypothetical protein